MRKITGALTARFVSLFLLTVSLARHRTALALGRLPLSDFRSAARQDAVR